MKYLQIFIRRVIDLFSHIFTLNQSRTQILSTHHGLIRVGHDLNQQKALGKDSGAISKRYGIANIDLIRTSLPKVDVFG